MTVDDLVFELAGLIDDQIVKRSDEHFAQSPRPSSFRSPLLHFLYARALHHRNAGLFFVVCDLAADSKTAREQRDDLIVERVQFCSPQLQFIHSTLRLYFAVSTAQTTEENCSNAWRRAFAFRMISSHSATGSDSATIAPPTPIDTASSA